MFIRGDVPASSPGGPLYIDYDHSSYGIGSEIHIFGYLVRK